MIWLNTSTIVWQGGYSHKDAMKGYKFAKDCFELLFPDGNCGFYHIRLSKICLGIANRYLYLGDEEQMFDYLEKSAEHAIRFDTLKDGSKYTAFMVDRLKYSYITTAKNYTENESGLLLDLLTGEAYSSYQNDPRMQKIIETLKPIAIM